ncbi:hypothetical protein GOBAR_DD16205 [Gossypium barbadense]|nr:hypothetical protein GOBAR_DD16205 [Gossypium barbadense]
MMSKLSTKDRTWIPYKGQSTNARLSEKDRNLYTIRAVPFADVGSIQRRTPALGWQYIIVVQSFGKETSDCTAFTMFDCLQANFHPPRIPSNGNKGGVIPIVYQYMLRTLSKEDDIQHLKELKLRETWYHLDFLKLFPKHADLHGYFNWQLKRLLGI